MSGMLAWESFEWRVIGSLSLGYRRIGGHWATVVDRGAAAWRWDISDASNILNGWDGLLLSLRCWSLPIPIADGFRRQCRAVVTNIISHAFRA